MRVTLALGSGGARGYAHVGVIRELEARGHEVVGVSGASMGAVVGSLFAAGKLDDFEEWVRGLTQRDVLRLLDVSFAGGGAIRANKIMAVIGAMLDEVRIEDLRIPYTAVATDLRARREVWFTSGPADVAVRASFAIPSVITPALVGGRLIIDGGVTNPVPLEPLASVESDLLVAVSLTGRRAGIRGSTFQESSDPDEASPGSEPKVARKGGSAAKPQGKLSGRIRNAAADVRDADLVRLIAARFGQDASGDQGDDDAADDPTSDDPDTDGSDINRPDSDTADMDDTAALDVTGRSRPSEKVEEIVEEGEADVESDVSGFESLPATLRIFDVVTHSLEVMESIITSYRMAGNRPDVLIEVPADSCTAFDFHRADEMIRLGRELTAEALERAGL